MKEKEFLELVEKSELAQHLDFFKQHMRQSYDIILLDKAADIGESRLGGHPDLPVDTVWPVHKAYGPYCFFAQINFAQIPQTDNPQLPKDGLLSLFYAIDIENGEEFWQDADYVLGIYTPAGTPLQTRKNHEVFDYFYPGKSIAIAFEESVDVPFDEYQVQDWPFNEEEADIYYDLVYTLHPSKSHLLGYPRYDSLAYDPTPEEGNFIPFITLPSYNALSWCWHDGDKLIVFQNVEKLKQGDFTDLKSDAG